MMKFTTKEEIIQRACELWCLGDAWTAGRVIDVHIPIEKRAEWIANILDVVSVRFEKDPSIDDVIDFARNPNKFGKGNDGNPKDAHRVVDTVNCFPYNPESFSQTIFILVAHAGKVVYNAQGFDAPFDYHAALTIFEIAKSMSQEFQDENFEKGIWLSLCPENLLVVESQPIYPEGWIEDIELSRSKK
ncbi:MAG: hypothetical protein ABI904_12765 [Chloroflexota bacterium]